MASQLLPPYAEVRELLWGATHCYGVQERRPTRSTMGDTPAFRCVVIESAADHRVAGALHEQSAWADDLTAPEAYHAVRGWGWSGEPVHDGLAITAATGAFIVRCSSKRQGLVHANTMATTRTLGALPDVTCRRVCWLVANHAINIAVAPRWSA